MVSRHRERERNRWLPLDGAMSRQGWRASVTVEYDESSESQRSYVRLKSRNRSGHERVISARYGSRRDRGPEYEKAVNPDQ